MNLTDNNLLFNNMCMAHIHIFITSNYFLLPPSIMRSFTKLVLVLSLM